MLIACPWCSKAIDAAGLAVGARIQCPRCTAAFTLHPQDLHAAVAATAPVPPAAPPSAPADLRRAAHQPLSGPALFAVGAAAAGVLLLVAGVILAVVLAGKRTPQVAAVPTPAPPSPLAVTPDPPEIVPTPDPPRKPLGDDPPPAPKLPPKHDPPPALEPPPDLTPSPPKPSDLPPDLQDKVNKAIDRGVAFLLKTQNDDGSWSFAGALGFSGESLVGPTALPGLTLLECGLPVDDPHIVKAAAYVRKAAPNVHSSYETYEIALAILFLDRLHDDKDEALLQALAVRLIAAQTATGGWTYRSAAVQSEDVPRLLTALRRTRPADTLDLVVHATASPSDPPKKPPAKPANDPAEVEKALAALAPSLRNIPALQPPRRDADFPVSEDFSTSDNSNTQFALLGLWTARRHDVPAERALALAQQRFRLSQREAGGWGYLFGIEKQGGVGGTPGWGMDVKPAMTAAGLLGLAVGHGVTADLQGDAVPKEAAEDPAVEKGMKALSLSIGKDAVATPGATANDLYFLWSVERVGVLYNRKAIGGKEWYPWGAEILVNLQQMDGSWADGLSPTPIGSSFALLFLKRANVARDLTDKLEFLTQVKPKDAAPPPDGVIKKSPGP